MAYFAREQNRPTSKIVRTYEVVYKYGVLNSTTFFYCVRTFNNLHMYYYRSDIYMKIKVTYNSNEPNNLELLYKLLVDIIVNNESISNQVISKEGEYNEENNSIMQGEQ